MIGRNQYRAVSVLMTVLMWLGFNPDASAKDIFDELADMPNVESTYVSGRFSHNMPQWRSSTGKRAINLEDGFSAIYTYECHTKEAVQKARAILKAYLKATPDMELMMRTKDGDSEYLIYEKFSAEKILEQMLVWSNDGPNVCEIVVINWEPGFNSKKRNNTTSRSSSPSVSPAHPYLDFTDSSDINKSQDLNNPVDWNEVMRLGNYLDWNEVMDLSNYLDWNVLMDLSNCMNSEEDPGKCVDWNELLKLDNLTDQLRNLGPQLNEEIRRNTEKSIKKARAKSIKKSGRVRYNGSEV